MKRKGRAVAFLEFEIGASGQISMALHRLDPAAFGHDDGYRFAFDKCLERYFARLAGFFEAGPAAAQLGFLGVVLPQSRQVLFKPCFLTRRTFK